MTYVVHICESSDDPEWKCLQCTLTEDFGITNLNGYGGYAGSVDVLYCDIQIYGVELRIVWENWQGIDLHGPKEIVDEVVAKMRNHITQNQCCE